MKVFSLLLLVVATASLVAAIGNNPMMKKPKMNLGWTQKARVNAEMMVDFRLALKQRNVDKLEIALLDVSNPKSDNYGQHWTPEKIIEFVSPPAEESEAVVTFLREKGVETIDNKGDVIVCQAPATLVEDIFNTQLYVFRHHKISKRIVRAVGDHSIPSQISNTVDFVAGLYEFPNIKSPRVAAPAPPQGKGEGYILPQLIQTAYSIPSDYIVSSNSSICLAEFQADQSYSEKDIKDFAQGTGLPLIKVPHKVGPFSSQDPDAESTLDVEYGASIALNNTDWFWTVNGWMYEFATDLFNTTPAPYIVSMSWGWPEPQQCSVGKCHDGETSVQYVERVNVEFMKIGMRGITLLAASGDQGAPGDSNPYCQDKKKPLSTIFPGASPWVLSVGATMLVNGSSDTPTMQDQPPICSQYKCATGTNEGVCTYPHALITTGGGFSDYRPIPSWQKDAVDGYLKSGVTLPPSDAFNKSNRGFPDVSALGHNYLIALSGDWTPVDGTSCSSPVFAGVIALLNDWRLLHGKSTLGFINPVIYQAAASSPDMFKDITTGNNKCTEQCCAKTGYEATKGWDPVTGLGTPNFPALLKFVQALK